MSKEYDDKAVAPEEMELKSDDMVMNVEPPPLEEDSDNSSHQRKFESTTVDEEETDEVDDAIKEEGEYLGVNSDIGEGELVEKTLVEETDTAAGQTRKNSALVIVGQNHKFNVRSRYLSDSVGSCHDLCKYGHKHESEKKTRRLSLGTIREAKPLMKTTSNNLENSVSEKVKKKKDLNRRLSLPGPIPEKAPVMRLEDKNLPKRDINDKNLPKRDINQSKMKRVQSEIKPSSISSPGNSSKIQSVRKPVIQSANVQEKPARKVKEMKTKKDEGSCVEGGKEVKAQESTCSSSEISVTKKAGYSKGVREIKSKEPMSNSPKATLKRSSSLKARLYKSRSKSSSSFKNLINPEEAKVDGHEDISEKTLYMIEPNSKKNSAEKTLNVTPRGGNLRSTPRAARASTFQGSNDGNRKGRNQLSSSSQESSQPRGEEQQGSESIKKTGMLKKKQTGIKTEDGGSKSSLSRAKSAVSRGMKSLDFKNVKQTDPTREDGRSKTNVSRAKSTVEPKLKPRRKETSLPEEKDVSAWKVKFKRGTVVALQAANNAPKKLRFKKRTLAEDQNAKTEVDRKLKNGYDMGNEPHDVKPEPEKVRLRHQEASEKKDDVDLNNVIEETASKLVKTRKSKVKALVGAFETVMSLHDRKRLVETNAS